MGGSRLAAGVAGLTALVVLAAAAHRVTEACALAGAMLTWAGVWVDVHRPKERRASGRPLFWAGVVVFAVAAVRLMLWETLPALSGHAPLPALGRASVFLVTVAAFYSAAWAGSRSHSFARAATGFAGVANLFTLWYVTLEIAIAMPSRTNGIIAGNRAMMTAAAWGLYGLVLAAAELRLRSDLLREAARIVLVAALGYLVMGAMQGNGIWARPPERYIAYAAVLGSAWAAEYLFRRFEADQSGNGLVAFLATLTGAYVGSFEVQRWLEPAFTLPAGQFPGAETFAWQRSTFGFWLMAVWGGYGLAVMYTGVRLRSGWTRLAAVAVAGLALLAFPLAGAWRLETAGALRLTAFALALGGAGFILWQGRRAEGGRLKAERPAQAGLALLAAATVLLWSGLEIYRLAAR